MTALSEFAAAQSDRLHRLAKASTSAEALAGPFYIVDMRPQWSRRPYVSVWRPDDKGYAYPLSWAGRYDKARVDAKGDYYSTKMDTPDWRRFPVACPIVELLAVEKPKPGFVHGNVGPVLPNTAEIRSILRLARYAPQALAA